LAVTCKKKKLPKSTFERKICTLNVDEIDGILSFGRLFVCLFVPLGILFHSCLLYEISSSSLSFQTAFRVCLICQQKNIRIFRFYTKKRKRKPELISQKM